MHQKNYFQRLQPFSGKETSVEVEVNGDRNKKDQIFPTEKKNGKNNSFMDIFEIVEWKADRELNNKRMHMKEKEKQQNIIEQIETIVAEKKSSHKRMLNDLPLKASLQVKENQISINK